MMPYKENRSGELQPYVPRGNGDRSGEYASFPAMEKHKEERSYCSFSDDPEHLFPLINGFTKEALSRTLTLEQKDAIQIYSDQETGQRLNRAARSGKVTEDEFSILRRLIEAIRSFRLVTDTMLYRGMHVNAKTYAMILAGIREKGAFRDQLIASTSCDRNVAVSYSKGSDAELSILFEIRAPKGTEALGIEELAENPEEREVLMIQPEYVIDGYRQDEVGNRTVLVLECHVGGKAK